tara:strand:+ start:2982 stop:3413 length:432 start_codon:yes stop_codon:yes gene_type:complete
MSDAISKATLREGLRGKGYCEGLGIGPRMYHLWQDNKYVGNDPLGNTLTLMKHSGNDIILDHICSSFNGIFVKNIEAEESKLNIFQDQSKIISEAADVIQVLTAGCSDGKMSREEIDTFKKEVDDFNKVAFGFINAAEKGRRE